MTAFIPARELRVLRPGELFCGSGPYTLSTIVGSGVSMCLWDPVGQVGGMSHYVEPCAPLGTQESFRFGAFAIPELVCRVRAESRDGHQLHARIFGGALSTQTPRRMIEANVALARDVLGALGIPIVSQVVGGSSDRQVVFDLETGKAYVRC